ncbi:hypothetical protein Dimus_011320 [Dionaea muscipula]
MRGGKDVWERGRFKFHFRTYFNISLIGKAINSLSLNFLSRDIGLLHETIEPTPTLASADLGAATDQRVEAATLECDSKKSSTVGNEQRRRHVVGGDFSSYIGDLLSREATCFSNCSGRADSRRDNRPASRGGDTRVRQARARRWATAAKAALAGGDFSSDIGDFLSRGGGVLAIVSVEWYEKYAKNIMKDLGAATDQQVEAATLECGSKSSTVGNGRRRRHLAGGDFSSDIGDFLSRGGGVLRSWFGSVEGGGDGWAVLVMVEGLLSAGGCRLEAWA